MSKLNIALIGSKFMGRTHSNAYLNVAKFFDLSVQPVMYMISARREAELKAFADRWGWKKWNTDWKQVVSDPEVGLVDIGTPNHVHCEQAVAALEAGKHVACEKPLAGTLEDARVMRDAAVKAKNQKTFVWFNYRRVPAVAMAQQMVAAGKLGRIYHVRAKYLQDWGGPDTPMLWRFQGDLAGSGALGDLGAHSIDATRFILSENITEVSGAIMKTFIEQRRVMEAGGGEISGGGAKVGQKTARSTVDDASLFLAKFEGGAVASFEATRLSTGDKNGNRIEIHGEKGAVRFDFERMNELQWYDATLEAKEQGWSTIQVTDGGAGHPYVGAWWPVGHGIGYEHGFVNQAADMLKALGGEKPEVALPDFADAYETQRVMAAVAASAKQGCAVPMSQVQ